MSKKQTGIGNYSGGMNEARKQFLKDLQLDEDFNEYKKNCDSDGDNNFGVISIEKEKSDGNEFRKLVKEWTKKQEKRKR